MLFHFDFRIAEIQERERRLRLAAERHRRFHFPRRRLRLQLGELLMRFGRFVGGEEAIGGGAMGAHANLRLG